MEIYIDSVGPVDVVALVGDLDGSSAPQAQGQILPLITHQARILLDMTDLEFMSSAGARMLLLIYRQITQNSGQVVLAGLSEAIADMLSATGFLDYFQVVATVDDGLGVLGA